MIVDGVTRLVTKFVAPPTFYTKNGHFHLIKSQPIALQKNVKISHSL